MNDAVRFVEATVAASRRALGDGAARTDERFMLGDTPCRLLAPATEAAGRIASALVPDARPPGARPQPAFEIRAWDGSVPDGSPPRRPWGPAAHEPLGLVDGFCNASVRCAFDLHTSCLLVQDDRSDTACAWYTDMAGLPAWAQASPFRIPLSWQANKQGMQVVHAGAVGIGDQAVLLVGAGGSGKSTTALACAMSGMSYLGDDYCLISPGERRVHMLYRTAKVLRASLDLVPALEPWLVNAERIDQEKGVMFLDPSKLSLARSARLKAIVMPRVGPGRRARLSPASRREALHTILPSTVGGLMGGTPATPALLMRLAAQAPAFHLELGNDMESVVGAVASLLRDASNAEDATCRLP